jgi:2'-5' RNA ligase
MLSSSSTKGDDDDDVDGMNKPKSSSNMIIDKNNNENKPAPPPNKKLLHSITVCMVPPPEDKNQKVWETVMAMRQRLKDPGFYRWPPHANLMYPFLEFEEDGDNNNNNNGVLLQEIVDTLHNATQECHPFTVTLNRYGTFGGKQRGVLWLDPRPLGNDDDDDDDDSEDDNGNNIDCDNNNNLQGLHHSLEAAFPMCKKKDQQTKGGGGSSFTPHMTLSHFENVDDALAGQQILEQEFGELDLQFTLDRIYLLKRDGDDGQFLRVAEIGLGTGSDSSRLTRILDVPEPFPAMPTSEEDWVREERMKLKARRNGGRGRGRRSNRRGGKQQRPRSREPRIPDTPEVIAAKRAERKTKREQIEREKAAAQDANSIKNMDGNDGC